MSSNSSKKPWLEIVGHGFGVSHQWEKRKIFSSCDLISRLWCCNITSDGCIHLSTLLQQNSSLTHLDLGLNHIGIIGLKFLCEALKKPLCKLRCLWWVTVLWTFSSVQFSRSVVSDSLRPHESQHARPPCPPPTPGVHPGSRPSSQWCHPAISSSVVPFSSCPQSLPASESFPMSQLLVWGGQSIGVSALASFLPKKSQGWSPSEWTGWISLQSRGLSRVFSNTTVQKHQFFGAQPFSQSNSHIHTWPQEKP